MKKLIIIITIVILLDLISCSDPSTQPDSASFNLGDTLLINYKETFVNSENDLSISFENLISDGRCPIDLMCFWEGDAEIEFKFTMENNTSFFSLHTAGNYFTKDTIIYGNSIKLIDLFPYPHSKIIYKPKDYSVRIVIE